MNKVIQWSDFAGREETFHVARIELAAGQNVTAHRHADYAEMLMVESGGLFHRANSRREELEPGEIVLIRPQDAHGLRAGEKGVVFVNVAIRAEVVEELQTRYFPPDIAPWSAQRTGPLEVVADTAVRARLSAQIERLAGVPRTRFEIDRFLMNVLHELQQLHGGQSAADLPDWLARACREIRTPVLAAEGLTAFYRIAARSPEHVARVLKKQTGKTPTQIVNEARLSEAARRLCMSSQEIIEISAACGFDNLGYFYRLFKARYGQSPRAYRIASRAVQ